MFGLYKSSTVKAMQKQWQDSLKEKQKDIDGLNKIIETLNANQNDANRKIDDLKSEITGKQEALNNVTRGMEQQHERIKELEDQLAKTIGVRDELGKANWNLAEEAKSNKIDMDLKDDTIAQLQDRLAPWDSLVVSIKPTKSGKHYIVSLLNAKNEPLLYCSPRSEKAAWEIARQLPTLDG